MTGPDTPPPGDAPESTPMAPPPMSPPPSMSPEPPTAWDRPAAPPPAPVPGAAGFVYADLPNRIIALIIDAIIVGIVTAIITGVLYGVIGSPYNVSFNANTGISFGANYVSLVIGAVISLVISAAYFVYLWTTQRATLGQRMLGMQVGNAADGKTLTMDQAVRRWAALFAPGSLAQIIYVLPTLGALVGLVVFIYEIYLLYTTYQSPTKQGFHDKFANTVVVKAARTV
ncbi:MAG TPA: RDD family protein [Candidatus Limnocylindrales bacterium]|jgi:uncharacterized RDD family membrane protein YckC